MSAASSQPDPGVKDVAKQVGAAHGATVDSFAVKTGEGYSEQLVDAIEMIGEETAAGFKPADASGVTAGMRYLHCSRTIHQLVTDRNRAVGIYLAVASLLLTASGALFHANPQGDLIIPLGLIQKWCLPITFGALAVLAVLIALLLIRGRIGLIYEVAKMNALLGLPLGRVKRVGVFSIFFILQAIISLAGGCAGALFSVFMIYLANPEPAHIAWWAVGIGAAITLILLLMYVVTVKVTTADHRLERVGKD